MSALIRHDAIKLKPTTNEDDFIKFMTETCMPYFKKTYKGLTRITISNLKDQKLLKDATAPGRFIWVSTWDGTEVSISDASFNGVVMTSVHEAATKEVLKKLGGFGKRTVAVFSTVD
ncbi:MAG: hypothetical protein V4722_00990 [Bacteroidota bacterium]